jgi:hypothetical protein
MGIQDRDWYRDLMREREREGLGSDSSRPVARSLGGHPRHNPYYVKPRRHWHPVISFLLTCMICFFVYMLVRFISRFA